MFLFSPALGSATKPSPALALWQKVTLDTPMSADLTPEAIKAMRRSYGDAGLHETEFGTDPIAGFKKWLADAAANPVVVEANAMVLSTADGDQPSSRTVLLKDFSAEGFSFFTNYNSHKGYELSSNPHVSLLFPWYPLERQVIVKGHATKVSRQESDEYFATRPWSSRIGAWASEQSSDLESREVLEERYAQLALKYPEGSQVPTPPHWGGFIVAPVTIEFWQGRYSRLHDRIIFTHSDNGWSLRRLNP